MMIFVRRALGGAGLVLFTAVATAGPIPLDTEQKAAAGVATALYKAEVPRWVNAVMDEVREYADFTLKTVNRATTPEALMSTPGGITINCSVSGSLQARMADALPRVLRVRWNDCVTSLVGFERKINGPVAITLPADTFRPQNVLAIRLGNASAEFLQQWRTESQEQNDDNTLAFHIALRGDIAMTRLFNCCEWLGSSSFVMKGYYDSQRMMENPVGTPPVLVGYKVDAERLRVIRSTNTANFVDEDDTRFRSGSVSFTHTQSNVWTDAYEFYDYHLRRITDYDAWNEQLSMNGGMNVSWSPFDGAGCMQGLYAFNTRVPLIDEGFNGSFESGELVVNDSVVASFYSNANTPPTLPTPVNGMLLNMQVRDVGTFNYDVASWYDALHPVGQCRR